MTQIAIPPMLGAAVAAVNLSPAVQAAWGRYRDKFEELQRFIYSWRFSSRPGVQLIAHDYCIQLQAYLHNTVMAPRTDYPRFFIHSHSEPHVYSMGFPCADFRYRTAYIDNERLYRIWGRPGTTRFLEFQVVVNHDADPEILKAFPRPTYHRLDQFALDADGSFEIAIGGKADARNRIDLQPGHANCSIIIREAFYDWENEQPAEVHIEVVNGPPPVPLRLDETEFIRRLDAMGRFLLYYADRCAIDTVEKTFKASQEHFNIFAANIVAGFVGVNQTANFSNMIYDIRPDEAVILEFDCPEALYWNVQLGNLLLGTTDYVYRQSSLNGHQAVIDSDRKVRMVLSSQDPGVPNWLDPAGTFFGIAQFRQYFTEKPVAPPTTKMVNFAEVRRHLPQDTAQISAKERALHLRQRSLNILKHYGY